jgi:hypothetical protein
VQGILTVIDRTEVKNAFGHWIKQCQWVATIKCEYYLEELFTAFLLFFAHTHICQYVRSVGHLISDMGVMFIDYFPIEHLDLAMRKQLKVLF